MNKSPALIFILSLTLLLSMTEIYKVTLLGFTVLTDAEKAAHFCTCTGCSHTRDMTVQGEDMMNSDDMNNDNRQEENEPSHCSTNKSDPGDAAVCACKASPEKERPILYNSLDKVALLSSVKAIHPSENERVLLIYQNRNEDSLSKEIFHPPKQA